MRKRELEKLDRDLTAFVDELVIDDGRLERRNSTRRYIEGLLLDGERKSLEAMARRLVKDEREVQAERQRLQECVTQPCWSDDEMRRRLARKLDAELPGIDAWVLDDTGFPKKGTHSVGVARQYSGTLGRTDNCQVATSLHLAAEAASACIGMRLYLSKEWVADEVRRKKTKVPEDIIFQTKWQIALSLIDKALAWGLQKRVVLADSAFGDVTEFREELVRRQLDYVLCASGTQKVWVPGTGPIAPGDEAQKPGRGRPRTRFKTGEQAPRTLVEAASERGEDDLVTLTWREGSRGPQTSRFGAMRVRSAHHHLQGAAPGAEVWLLYSWPVGEPAPVKYWLSSLPETTSLKRLVFLAKLRWRVERDYQEMKGEVGLDHYEGRTWHGFHHHCTFVSVAHAFLALQRALFPPIDLVTVDAASGPSSAPAAAGVADRSLPAVLASGHCERSAKKAIAHLIE